MYPGVVLLGPRQVGKTTLARAIAAERSDAVVLDLERPADRARISEPAAYASLNCAIAWPALDNIQADRAFVIAPVEVRYPLGNGVEVLPLQELDAVFE